MGYVDPGFSQEPYFKDFVEWEERGMPGAPDLSHYYGRSVTSIVGKVKDGETPVKGQLVWQMTLDGGIVIQNYDENLPVPGDHIVGQVFTNMTIHSNVTSMFFGGLGGNTVSLNPMKYAIVDTDVIAEPYFPQLSEVNPGWVAPPEEPVGRTAEQPDDSWLAENQGSGEGS